MAARKVPTGSRPSNARKPETPQATATPSATPSGPAPSTRTAPAAASASATAGTSSAQDKKDIKVKMIASREELEKTIEEAGNKLVLLEFFAEWCGPCKIIGLKLEELATTYIDQLIVIKVDVDDFEDLALEHDVTSMPTFMIFRNKAKVAQFVGSDEQKVISHLFKHLEIEAPVSSDPATSAQVTAAPSAPPASTKK